MKTTILVLYAEIVLNLYFECRRMIKFFISNFCFVNYQTSGIGFTIYKRYVSVKFHSHLFHIDISFVEESVFVSVSGLSRFLMTFYFIRFFQ